MAVVTLELKQQFVTAGQNVCVLVIQFGAWFNILWLNFKTQSKQNLP
jgi:hypothetical protein